MGCVDRHLVFSVTDNACCVGLTFEDILTLSPKFWKIHNDPIAWHDGSSITIMTIHLNLAVGTIGTYAKGRPELQRLCADMMDCKAMLVHLRPLRVFLF